MKIIFVCWGNICRSPMAEYIMKSITKDATIYSRGLSNEEYGNDIYPYAKEMLDKHSIKYDKHFAKKITKEEYLEADYVVVVEDYQIDRLIDLFGYKDNILLLNDKNIEDPWYTGKFEKVYEEIYEGCLKLKEKIWK